MTLDQTKAKTVDLLTRKPQQISAGLEALGAAPAVKRRFSVFIGSDLKKANDLTERWMQITKAKGDAGLDEVLADADAEMQTKDSDLVKHALLMFITHDPVGRQLPIPPLVDREPEAVVPSSRSVQATPVGLEALGGTGKEAALDYFREDTWINEHHAKWHVVYPASGINGKLRNRQGELFWYMHQQMLARYDAERVSVGLKAVVPLDKFDQPIEEGYDPEIPGNWAARPDDSDWPAVPLAPGQVYGPQEHADRRDRLRAAAETGQLQHPDGTKKPIKGPEQLACTLEANAGSVEQTEWDPFSFNGSYHNVGHVLIASSGDPGSGVMTSTATAVRDPVFYRWHRNIDDIMDRWWRTQPAHDLDKSDPQVAAKEIGVISAAAIPAGTDPQVWAQAEFGGANWGNAPAGIALDKLTTLMGSHNVPGPGGNPIKKPHLDHEEFFWLLRCENPTNHEVEVTFRVFLALDQYATTERRAWIEMDKFTAKVPANGKHVQLRSGRSSSVVRKPALRPGEPKPAHGAGPDDYCDCGWPYHLLLPRGATAGTAFRALVLLTDWATDRVADEKKHKCGSVSFCGARDADYPDKHEMGYPFNRPIDLGKLVQRGNVASRKLTITHKP